MTPLKSGTRLCGVCLALVVPETISREWTPEHGVVETFRHGSHQWQESRLPLDDPRNLSPFKREELIRPKERVWKSRPSKTQ